MSKKYSIEIFEKTENYIINKIVFHQSDNPITILNDFITEYSG